MSWEQLQQILDEESRVDPPVACPNDGTVLEADGPILYCPFDFWTWPIVTLSSSESTE